MNKKLLFVTILFSFGSLIQAEEFEILSPTQKSIFNTKKKIIEEDKKINEKSWLSNINLNSSIVRDKDEKDTKEFSLSYEQPIFKFGGILNTIDVAKIQEQYDLMDLNITFIEYINTIYTTVVNLKLTDLNIKKQKLSIENKTISLDIIKAEYKAGQTDVTNLNDTIMEKNALEEELAEQLRTKQEYLATLSLYTKLDYKKIDIPNLKLKELDSYLKDSRDIKLAKYNEDISKLNYKIKKSDYLPELSLTSNYGYDFTKSDGENSYNYGVKLSIPISFSSINEIEKYQLDYLLSQREKEQKEIDETVAYNKIIENIRKYNNSTNIASKDIKLYEELLDSVSQEYNAGYKAIEDVEILSNTKKMRELDVEINKLNILTQLIAMYY
ncbi:hypothetical protein CRV08_01180 [Halarcobacter ebronensis]|uniref:Transporter n=1 Tax=Halarcobacter ebronensis TaxID=1462615 RepID=A0A4Q0YHR7_9BACT|nr:TolC family protein [Halarcobacter ebronensis]RXJ70206.1 hypothetical protein CRV08_01180 [Halarcobacter ebronensis]